MESRGGMVAFSPSDSANGPARTHAVRVILLAGLGCGVLDIGAAFLDAYLSRGVTPDWVLRAVASAVLGAQSFKLGAWSAALGLVLHFLVALGWAAIFYAVARRWPEVLSRVILSGLGFGAVVYVAMNVVVLPLTSVARSLYLDTAPVFAPRFAWGQFVIHLTCVGLAIALLTRRGVGGVPRKSPRG